MYRAPQRQDPVAASGVALAVEEELGLARTQLTERLPSSVSLCIN